MNRANHTESIRAFKLAAKYYDKDEIHSLAIIYFYLGYSHFELQENLISIEYFFKAIELDKTRPDLYGFLADALDRLERYEESLENIDIAISLSQNTSSVLYNNKAVTLNCMGRHTEALETLNRGLQTTDQNNINISYIYCNTGMSHVALGNLDEAKRCYEKSLELYPNNPKTSIKMKEYHEIIKKMPQEPHVCDTKI
jgi:tetratricopeptide (TPR) repeat protein